MSSRDKKSTTGYVIQFQGNIVCWKSKKQSVVAQSTTGAEFIAINVCAKQIQWFKNLFIDMKVPVGVPCIRNDNAGAVIISQELCLSKNSKHIEIRFQYLRDIVAKNQLTLEDIATDDMIADISEYLTFRTSKEEIKKEFQKGSLGYNWLSGAQIALDGYSTNYSILFEYSNKKLAWQYSNRIEFKFEYSNRFNSMCYALSLSPHVDGATILYPEVYQLNNPATF
ncbi:hypothetical protein MJO29_014424 [Puccinia striiformis f. sp. tritici]|nr:hypothetical protein MJO29_014424 [Puccinia striiformis f. sp. tritici]